MSKLPVGAVVTKRCSCGGICRAAEHPRYEVVGFTPNRSMPGDREYGTWRLRRLDNGRVHTTRTVDGYAILQLPTEAVLVEP